MGLFLIGLGTVVFGIYKGFPGWTPPDDIVDRRQIVRFRASIFATSLAVFLLVPLPFWGQRIYRLELMTIYLFIGVVVLWTVHFYAMEKHNDYWGKVTAAATTLLPVWWFSLMDPLSSLYRITLGY